MDDINRISLLRLISQHSVFTLATTTAEVTKRVIFCAQFFRYFFSCSLISLNGFESIRFAAFFV